jgi:hypothetical protein
MYTYSFTFLFWEVFAMRNQVPVARLLLPEYERDSHGGTTIYWGRWIIMVGPKHGGGTGERYQKPREAGQGAEPCLG